jgi:hypothetical protein
MSSYQKVKATYTTTDGKQFDTSQEAYEHQRYLDIAEKLTEFAKKYATEDMPTGQRVDQELLARILIAKQDELRDIL